MTPGPDHLLVWLSVRDAVAWHKVRPADVPHGSPAPIRDGAVHDIRTHDHARDPQRAARLLSALGQARTDAAAGSPLTFDLLSAWQHHVLDVPRAPFRQHPAFAKAGRERYGAGPHLRQRFDVCLGQSEDPALPLAARAARTYLDICFFHPFDDGNARSAFLALDFLLARAGIVLDQVAPVRRIHRHADDPDGALALANLVSILVADAISGGRASPAERTAGRRSR